jgi:hypothetical protein
MAPRLREHLIPWLPEVLLAPKALLDLKVTHGQDPEEVESALITDFTGRYRARPFGNRKAGGAAGRSAEGGLYTVCSTWTTSTIPGQGCLGS